MRLVLVLITLAACGGPELLDTHSKPLKLAPSETATAAVHRFFDAVDSRNVDLFTKAIAPNFALFEDGRATSADVLVGYWDDASSPLRQRQCKSETIRQSHGSVVYTGDCTETPVQGGSSRAAKDSWQGWNTVVLVSRDDSWDVVFWQWQPSGIAGERIRWNDAYRRGNSFSKEPTSFLVDSIKNAVPGRALVLAMGQGRNALYLATQGWQVTGVDLSDIGIAKAQAAATRHNLSLHAEVADIDEYPFGDKQWELVTMLYAGGSLDWIQRSQAALVPGGLFVFEHFFDDSGADDWNMQLPPEELERLFAGWEIIENRVTTDRAEWGMKSSRLLRFTARKR